MVLLYHFWQYRAYFSVRYCPKTLAFKITEELDQRLKNFIAAEKKHGRKITQKEFVIGLIEQALDAYEAQNQPAEMSEE